MNLRVSALVERIRSSLFFIPMLAVLAATALGLGLLAVDRRVDDDVAELPLVFTSTVESARTLLGTIAGATISFAGIAFSVTLLILQLASSQYSPRIVHTLFRDPFNKRVMALVVGTFTYCVVVLRSVRSALDSEGEPVIPNLSVAFAVLLGIGAILAIVAFIDHNAHAMDVSEIMERIRRDTTQRIRASWEPSEPGDPHDDAPPTPAAEPGSVIRAANSGWIQQIDTTAIVSCLPSGATAYVHTSAGRYVIEHGRLLSISPAVDDDDLADGMRAAFAIGDTRTMQQDVTYGLRQVVDIAVKALSPGINDPTTAQDAMSHAAAVVSELLRRRPPPATIVDDDRHVVMADQPSYDDIVRTAFDEVRRAAAAHPTVCVYLLEILASLVESLSADGFRSRTAELRRQAHLVVEGCGRNSPLPDDIASVRGAYAHRFAGPGA
jgi:uncharacterized membrane protein